MFNMKFFLGQVESKCVGPEAAAKYPFRVRVRVFGLMDNYSNYGESQAGDSSTGRGLPTSDLPYAMCLYPVTFGGTAKSTCPPPALEPGAVVFGVSLDGDLYNELLIIGCVPGAEALNDLGANSKGSSMGNSQANRVAAAAPASTSIMSGVQSAMSNQIRNNNPNSSNYSVSAGTAPINYGATEKFGAFQINPVDAAQMMLQSNGFLSGANGSLDPDLKKGLEMLVEGDTGLSLAQRKARGLEVSENSPLQTLPSKNVIDYTNAHEPIAGNSMNSIIDTSNNLDIMFDSGNIEDLNITPDDSCASRLWKIIGRGTINTNQNLEALTQEQLANATEDQRIAAKLLRFIQELNSNYQLNKAMANNIMATAKKVANDDPIITLFLFFNGIDEGLEMLDSLGYNDGLLNHLTRTELVEKLITKSSNFEDFINDIIKKNNGNIENISI